MRSGKNHETHKARVVSPGEPVHSQFTVTDARELKHPACVHCGKAMWLTRIQPDKIGCQIRTFECADCARTVSVSIAMTRFAAAPTDDGVPPKTER